MGRTVRVYDIYCKIHFVEIVPLRIRPPLLIPEMVGVGKKLRLVGETIAGTGTETGIGIGIGIETGIEGMGTTEIGIGTEAEGIETEIEGATVGDNNGGL